MTAGAGLPAATAAMVRRELAVAGLPPFVAQAESAGGPSCRRRERRVVGLGEVHEPLVVAEVLVAQLRMSIQPETLDDQPVEVARQEVGQEERGGLVVDELRELRARRVELVAVRAGEPFDALLGDHRIEQPACPAVGVRHEDPVVAGAASPDAFPDGGGDPARTVMERGRQAGDVDVRQVLGQRDELACEGATPDDEDAGLVLPARSQAGTLARARRSSISRRAVSAATPASRQ